MTNARTLEGVVPCCESPTYDPAHLLMPFGIKAKAAYCRCCGELTCLHSDWLEPFVRLLWNGEAVVHEDECEDSFVLPWSRGG